jgi:hypothetical protein
MLTLTHAAIGFIFCYLLFKDKRIALIGLLFGAMPDLDGLFIFFDYAMHLQVHRTLLHPFIWGLIFAIPVVLIFRHKLKWDRVGVACLIGYSMHIICDVFFTKWPIPIFWPLSDFTIAYPILNPFIMTIEGIIIGAFGVLIIVNYDYYFSLLHKKIHF